MKKFGFGIALVALLGLSQVKVAEAGCLGGAVVGGVAGHMVGHGGVGAAAGCAVGHHRSVTRARNANSAPATNTGGQTSEPSH